MAAEFGRAAALKILIEVGCDVNAANGYGYTLAHLAAENGHAAALEVLIKAGRDFDSADNDGKRPLSIAALEGRLECARVLIRAGAELVADGEVVEDGLQRSMSPELLCLQAMRIDEDEDDDSYLDDDSYFGDYSDPEFTEVHELLRTVRLAGSWRSYVTGQRRALATLMALWKRRAAAASPRRLTRSDSSAPSHQDAAGDVAVWVLELPSHLAGRILCFYTDLVL